MTQERVPDDTGNNFAEKLVELVGKNPIIYDTREEGYSNFLAQDETWRRIAGELNEDDTRLVISDTVYSEDTSSNPFLHYEEDLEIVTKAEPIDNGETSTQLEPDVNLDEEGIDKLFDEEVNTTNKRQNWETNSEHEVCKRSKLCESDEAELNFFKSLLPDIHKMNGRQRNKLKIAILDAVNRILYNEDS